MSKNLEVLRFYRFACKHVAKPPKTTLFRDFIVKNKDKELTQKHLSQLKDYMLLFSVTSENKELLLRYRIGIERETHGDIENISRKVGLRLPKLKY